MLEYKELQDVDLKLHLLSGSSIKVDNLIIEPYALKEIKDYGYSKYMKNLQLMLISVDDFITSVKDNDKRTILEERKADLKTFDFYMNFGGEELLFSLMECLKMVFKTEDVVLLDERAIAINFIELGILKYENENLIIDEEILSNKSKDEITIVHRDNFDNIVEVIKLQNYLIQPKKQEEEKFADEATRKLYEEMEAYRKKVEEKKKAQQETDSEDVDLSDIIDAVSTKSNSINKLNIWDFTLYQIYREYARLEVIDNYEFALSAMLAGANKEELNFSHWSSKI